MRRENGIYSQQMWTQIQAYPPHDSPPAQRPVSLSVNEQNTILKLSGCVSMNIHKASSAMPAPWRSLQNDSWFVGFFF